MLLFFMGLVLVNFGWIEDVGQVWCGLLVWMFKKVFWCVDFEVWLIVIGGMFMLVVFLVF